MKFIFKILIVSLSALMMNSPALGQSANGSASGEQAMNFAQAGVSGGLGGWMIQQGMAAGPVGTVEIAMGGMMVMSGLSDLATASARNGDINPTSADLGTGSTGLQNQVPAAVQAAVNQGVAAAQAAGIDPTNPASVAAAAQNAGIDDSPDGLQAAMAKLSPETLAGLEKEKQALMNQFHVSSVGVEGGGGGSVAKGNKSGDGDLAGLLAGLNGNGKGERGPASVDGLSKLFNGNAIGVAGDNIFKQVSRRYQTKIQQKNFSDFQVKS